MPDYSMPSWLRAAQPAQHWLSGVSAGTSIAAERNRVAAQQAQLQVEQQRQDAEARMEEQKLEISKEAQRQQSMLKQAELEQENARIEMATEQAARRFQAQQTYERMVASGMDPAQAMLQIGPSIGMSAGDLGAALRATKPVQTVPSFGTTEGGLEYGSLNGKLTFAPRQQATKPAGLEGPLQVQPVIGPDGKALQGMVAVPTGTGGWTVRNVPDKAISRATAQLKMIEEGPFGIYLATGKSELPENPDGSKPSDEQSKAYQATRERYERLQQIISGEGAPANEQSPPNGEQPSAAEEGGITFKRIRRKGETEWTDLPGAGSTNPAASSAEPAMPKTLAPPTTEEPEEEAYGARDALMDLVRRGTSAIRNGAGAMVRGSAGGIPEMPYLTGAEPAAAPEDIQKRRVGEVYYVDGEPQRWTENGWEWAY